MPAEPRLRPRGTGRLGLGHALCTLALNCLGIAVLGCREPTTEPGRMSTLQAAPMKTPGPQPAHDCDTPQLLIPKSLAARSELHVADSTAERMDTNRSGLLDCREATAGPDVAYRLDLSAFDGAVELHAVLDADFDAVLELKRGACGDTSSLECDRARGLTHVGSSIARRLDPERYWLVVDGADANAYGDFQLHVELDPSPGECSAALPETTCTDALALNPVPRQTLLLDEACIALGDDGDSHLWYSLNLEEEPQPVVLRATAWSLGGAAEQTLRLLSGPASPASDCSQELAYSQITRGLARINEELTSRVTPGQYLLELRTSQGAPPPRSALEVRVDRDACPQGALANDCESARPIDVSLPVQVIDGDTTCNANRFESRCAEVDAPEQFFELDLRSAVGLTRVRVAVQVENLGFPPILALVTPTSEGTCGETVYCDERIDNAEGPARLDLVLAPALYYLVVDGANAGLVGPFQLLVELGPGERRPCVDGRIDSCVYANGQANCCFEWNPICSATTALCGLSPETERCLCAEEPACCAQERDLVACRAARERCAYLCPTFAASENACLARQ